MVMLKDRSIENVIMPVADICLGSFISPTYTIFMIFAQR